MHRRRFVAAGFGLMALAAGQGLVGPFNRARLRAQPANAPPGAGPPQGKWIRLAAFPQATGELLGAAVNGKLYATQGLLPGFKPAGLVYEYDPARDAWMQKKPMPHPLHHAAVTVQDGKMYLFGGFDLPPSGPPGWNPLNDAWEYDPASDIWRALAPMPTARGGGVAAVVGGKFYVIGGAGPTPEASAPTIRPRQPQRSLGAVEEYDPRSNTWRARSPLPTPCNHMGSEALNGKIYVIGGRLSGAFIIGLPGNINLVQAYDPAADSWVTKTPMPTARSGLNTASLNGIIYAAGGEVQDDKYLAAYRAFEAYDPASDTWWQLPSMLLPRHECIMAAVGNRIHVAGGTVQSAIVPLPKGLSFDTDSHEAFEVAS
ncbi:MAG TPA: kelch repeat-containing protein [Casimicrobiaceae bacterium]|nr:kelch repeat-containing protein [Casimicrobiaceae bacterium]